MYELKYRSEDEMKDSGVEWLGDVPKEWEELSLNRVIRFPIVDGPHETPEYVERGIPFISVDSLNEKEYVNLNIVNRFISERKYKEYNNKTNLTEGDILFSKSASIGKTAIVDDRTYMTWSPLAIIKANHKIINNKVLYYIVSSNRFIEHVTSYSNLNTQLNIGMKALEKSRLVISHSLLEQQKIANFLDIKASQFDSIIFKKEKFIEKLEEAKKSLISEVVTGKVKIVDGQMIERNPDEIKDSGVEWLGMIPMDWEVKKFKTIFKSYSGKEILKEKNINKDKVDVYGSGGIFKKTHKFLHNGESVLFGRKGTIGKPIYVNKKFWTVDTMYYTIAKNNINTKMIYYQLLIYDWNLITTKTALPSIVANDLENEYTVMPIKDEQDMIINSLENKIYSINNIITKTKSQIQKLKEAKASLISEAVTGKVDLRDWEIKNKEDSL